MLLITVLTLLLLAKAQCQQEAIDELLKTVAESYRNATDNNRKPPAESVFPNLVEENYDFIIVGAGSAGSVIANRLSEVPQWKILLIEAGEEADAIAEIPALAPVLQFTDYNWNYRMEKDDRVGLGLQDGVMAWPRGKALGGSSLLNFMVHTRGSQFDYDLWANLGNPGWSYREVLPYFIKSEDFLVKKGDLGYHQRGGELGIEKSSYRTRSAEAFVKAFEELGFANVDYNGRNELGVSYMQGTLRNGRRCSTDKAFLRPARLRPNLKILTRARVTRVLIDPFLKQAFGVEYHRNGEYHRVGAVKEVVLSASSLISPQLLMLSGIGPKKDLEDLKIPLIQDLPVGQKLYDHIFFMGLTFTANDTITSDITTNFNVTNMENFVRNGKGPLTVLAGLFEALAFIKTNVSEEISDNPDIEFVFASGGFHSDGGSMMKQVFRISDQNYNTLWKPLEGKEAFQIYPMLVHPESHGFLKLKSTNPYDTPKFYGNYLSDPNNKDVKTFIASIRAAQKLTETSAFKKYNIKLDATVIPGCAKPKYDSDEYWECAVRNLISTAHHQSTTCKMGPWHDKEAVVNHELKVHGVGRLRVADTGIIPVPLAGHTNGPAIMVGEKAADLIKVCYGVPTILIGR